MRSKKWYADRGIPFRRGYLLYGAPGSGKTSIIHSLAGELGLDIYVISLSTAGLDDTGLNSLISALPEQCIALMEDIDAAFTHGLTRETVGTELEDPRDAEKRKERLDDPDGSGGKDAQRDRKQGADSTRITLSGLLNALDGVSAQEGRLLFATTNRYSALDPALTRPGRMDLHVEFMLASRYQAKEMFKRFYVPEDEKEGEDADDVDEKGSDSGYSSSSKKEDSTGGPDLIDLSVDLSSSTPAAPAAAVPPNYTGLMHSTRAPTLSKRQIERLATQFADTLPDREFSMASLQGYLMSYKIRPVQAVDDVARWVERKTQERGSKVKPET
ncbi:AAA+-type ATPase [Heterobasidion irregulare TC 32-1]|uniref:AAA+-type ATPase n=1 Tax=Heterobasidion irregulare (strain TC 32-1) TaxID=747525 RepID=W4JYP6_HETIT|nr:AAA+-type ATPase [Heterobasidion irregulare TC 32-1]ETW78673.1 AAA+-type ATPase [Heterobasidion irregulare TC 32-1]